MSSKQTARPKPSKQPPLTPDQRRAASLMAAGLGRNATAAEIGVSPKTVQRLKQREDFMALVRKMREGLMPESPTAEAVLVQGLSATRADGRPDWPTKIASAKAILSTEIASPESHEAANRVTEIYLAPPPDETDDDDLGHPRPFPIDGVNCNGNGNGEADDA